MSFDKKYPNRKDHRKPYHHSERFDRSCRPHGGCPWCLRRRLYSKKRSEFSADEQIREYNED